jgi:hypothetical protein
MRYKQSSILITTLLLSGVFARLLCADELAGKGRDILKKYQHAVVTVQVVTKATDRSGRPRESKQDITGTVTDPSGLTVIALSACDATEMYRRLSPDSKVEVEVSDIKILLEDGTELPSEIVLRDGDFDLGFIRPKSKPARPLTAVDLSKAGPAEVLDEVVYLNRLNKAASRAYAASVERISAVIQKPRTFYVPEGGSSRPLGAPIFLMDGRFLGMFVMRAVTGGSGEFRENLTSIIIPAEDILKAAKQAPEAKGVPEKKEEPKATPAPKDGAAKE